MMSSGIPYFFMIYHNEGRWIQSKAFLKSMKFIITGLCQAVTFSTTCLKTNICSLHGLPRLKPACSCRSWLSITCLILSSRTLANTLPGTDSTVIPRQLLQSVRSQAFFGSGMIIPFFQSECTVLLADTSLHSVVSTGINDVEDFWRSRCIWSIVCRFSIPQLFSCLSYLILGDWLQTDIHCDWSFVSKAVYWFRFSAVEDRLQVLMPSLNLLFMSLATSLEFFIFGLVGVWVVVEYQTRNQEVAGSTHTQSTASNLEQVANLLCAQANSASNPQQDWKWVVATATGWRPSVADWGDSVSASCTVGPIVC